MKWLWEKLKSVPILGWVLVALAGIFTLKFAGGGWLEKVRTKKAIKREKVAIEKERQEYHEKIEDERRADHDACIFDD